MCACLTVISSIFGKSFYFVYYSVVILFLILLGVVAFPIDFFEHCQAMNEVEFGGNDLLQIYNTQQIKHRLNTTGINYFIYM